MIFPTTVLLVLLILLVTVCDASTKFVASDAIVLPTEKGIFATMHDDNSTNTLNMIKKVELGSNACGSISYYTGWLAGSGVGYLSYYSYNQPWSFIGTDGNIYVGSLTLVNNNIKYSIQQAWPSSAGPAGPSYTSSWRPSLYIDTVNYLYMAWTGGDYQVYNTQLTGVSSWSPNLISLSFGVVGTQQFYAVNTPNIGYFPAQNIYLLVVIGSYNTVGSSVPSTTMNSIMIQQFSPSGSVPGGQIAIGHYVDSSRQRSGATIAVFNNTGYIFFNDAAATGVSANAYMMICFVNCGVPAEWSPPVPMFTSGNFGDTPTVMPALSLSATLGNAALVFMAISLSGQNIIQTTTPISNPLLWNVGFTAKYGDSFLSPESPTCSYYTPTNDPHVCMLRGNVQGPSGPQNQMFVCNN